MNALDKIKLSKELASLVASLKGGQLKALEKIKASKRVGIIVSLFGKAQDMQPTNIRDQAIQLVTAWVAKKELNWDDRAVSDFVDKTLARFEAARDGELADYIVVRELLNNGMNPMSQTLFSLFTHGQVSLKGLTQKDGKFKLDEWSKFTTEEVDQYYAAKYARQDIESSDRQLASDWNSIAQGWREGILDRLKNKGYEIIARKSGVAMTYIFGNGTEQVKNVRKSQDMRYLNSFMREAFKRYGAMKPALIALGAYIDDPAPPAAPTFLTFQSVIDAVQQPFADIGFTNTGDGTWKTEPDDVGYWQISAKDMTPLKGGAQIRFTLQSIEDGSVMDTNQLDIQLDSTDLTTDAINVAQSFLRDISSLSNNPLYQSVLDGAEVTPDLIAQLIEEAKKNPSHAQLKPAIKAVVGLLKNQQEAA